MARKRKRNKKVDTSKMTPKEYKNYRKHLADVRTYVRAKREWQKRIKTGELSPRFTLTMYRQAKAAGKRIPTLSELEAGRDQLRSISPQAVIDKVQTLFRELRETESKKVALETQIKKLTAIIK